MKYPNFNEEKKLLRQGYKLVAGLDEAGRGPLAGPVVAAAVNLKFEIFNLKSILNNPIFKKIKDSKKLNAKQREEIYETLIKHPGVRWGVGVVSEKVIDKINILEASKLAMQKAVKNLSPDFLLIDGNFKLNKINILQKSVIKGIQKFFQLRRLPL